MGKAVSPEAKRGAKNASGSKLYDQPHEGLDWLRVRNVSADRISFDPPRGMGGPNLVLAPWVETVVPKEFWQNNVILKKRFEDGTLVGEWVDAYAEPRPLPSVDNAPPDARPEKAKDKHYAWQIAMDLDMERAIKHVQAEVIDQGTKQPDKRVLNERMKPILNLVLWLEPQVQNRKPVITAAKERLSEIKAL